MSDIKDFTASMIVEKIALREISCVEVAQSMIHQCHLWENINSLVNFDEKKFLGNARKGDTFLKSGLNLGPLHGLPLIIKDNIDVEGFITTAANRSMQNFKPNSQGPVVENLINAGAIIMSKSNMHELAFTPGIKKNSQFGEICWGAFGSAKNPYDIKLSPSGSSSGTAAAIAARIAPAGLGTDTGGSVRNPSAWCGIAGLRPTIKRYSQRGVVPISWTRDTIGPMARSIQDLALMDGVITHQKQLPHLELVNLRLGIDRKFFCTGCEPEILNRFENQLRSLCDTGLTIIDIDLQNIAELIDQIGHIIARYEVVRALPKYLESSGLKSDLIQLADSISADGLGDVIKSIATNGAITDPEYNHVMTFLRPSLQKIYTNAFFEHKIDAIIFPSTLVPPNDLNSQEMYNVGSKEITYLMASNHNVQPASIGGYPGLTIPIGSTSKGLPIAMGLDGLPNSDRKLLAIGLALEKTLPRLHSPKI